MIILQTAEGLRGWLPGSNRYVPVEDEPTAAGADRRWHIGERLEPAQPPHGRFRLRWSFAAWPGKNGLVGWDRAKRRYVRMPSMTDLQRLSAGATADDLEQPELLCALVAAGAVAPEERLAGEHALVEANAQVLCPPDRPSSETAVKLPQPDGRIPVYFVHSLISRDAGADLNNPNEWRRWNYLPLAIGMLFARVRDWDGGALTRVFQLVPRFVTDPAELLEAVGRFGVGVAFFSDYEWNVEVNLHMSAALKDAGPDFLIVHGGPSAPKYPDACNRWLQDNPSVDVVVRGEGENTVVELLAALAGSFPRLDGVDHVSGITLRDGTRTPDRPRIECLDELPSPYLSGVWDHLTTIPVATLETNRGCPYGCTFCDWGSATMSRVRRFSLDRVMAEIDWLSERRVGTIWCADANFGMLRRDVDIARHIARCRRNTGYPHEFIVNFAKNTNQRIADIVEILVDAGLTTEGIVAIQSTDEATLKAVNRNNIKTPSYDKLVEVFQSRNLPLSSDLMIGLPGSNPKSFQADLQRYFDRGVRVKAYLTRVLPNSPMAEPGYMSKHAIEVDDDGFVISSRSFNRADHQAMVAIYRWYRGFAGAYGVLTWPLRVLQRDYDLPMTDTLQPIASSRRLQRAYPVMTWVVDCLSSHGKIAGGWRRVCDEFALYIEEQFNLSGSDIDSALRLQEAILPDEAVEMPAEVELRHDIVAWVQSGYARPLRDFSPGSLTVSDPDRLSWGDPSKIAHSGGMHVGEWELDWVLREHRVRRHWVVSPNPVRKQQPQQELV